MVDTLLGTDPGRRNLLWASRTVTSTCCWANHTLSGDGEARPGSCQTAHSNTLTFVVPGKRTEESAVSRQTDEVQEDWGNERVHHAMVASRSLVAQCSQVT